MAKLQKQYYYLRNGGKEINCYHIVITKKMAEDVGFTPEDELKIEVKGNEIIIRKESK